ncbi:hypothetical protein [uncultured Acinetobacter sp.]|uniref:hypothetical protein n=1 Tax=uncultured Acinetobacter sp. TaxID=165433 RepID=UPI00258E8FEC|nr:hypothetical protein [uncultured Acinetobacter sp.]
MRLHDQSKISPVALFFTAILHIGLVVFVISRPVEQTPEIKKGISVIFMPTSAVEQNDSLSFKSAVKMPPMTETLIETPFGQYDAQSLEQTAQLNLLEFSQEATKGNQAIDPLLAAQLRAKQAIRRAKVTSDQYQLNPEKIDPALLSQLNLEPKHSDTSHVKNVQAPQNSELVQIIEIYPFISDQIEIEQFTQALMNQPYTQEQIFQENQLKQQILSKTEKQILQSFAQHIDELVFLILPSQSRVILVQYTADLIPSDDVQSFLKTLDIEPLIQNKKAKPYLVKVNINELMNITTQNGV